MFKCKGFDLIGKECFAPLIQFERHWYSQGFSILVNSLRDRVPLIFGPSRIYPAGRNNRQEQPAIGQRIKSRLFPLSSCFERFLIKNVNRAAIVLLTALYLDEVHKAVDKGCPFSDLVVPALIADENIVRH